MHLSFLPVRCHRGIKNANILLGLPPVVCLYVLPNQVRLDILDTVPEGPGHNVCIMLGGPGHHACIMFVACLQHVGGVPGIIVA